MALIKCCFETREIPEVLDDIIKKCTDSRCCCGCCNALRPRYKRLVDNIFPVSPEEGLVKANMEKLTFYSLSSPEKLDRIGEYLYQRASRDIYRRRNGFVIIAMEAIDQLLIACHAQSLNLFVESYLKMVQKLLESPDAQLQILATQSFVRFANIEEVTPSYHRRYDFFVSKFSSMCHSNEGGEGSELRDNIRLAGIRGLQAVVRKTVSDDLVENIWEPTHMDKIVPSLLFNMQNSHHFKDVVMNTGESHGNMQHLNNSAGNSMMIIGGIPMNDDDTLSDPPTLAESCLRELVGRASFGHIRSVLRPVLKHFELHGLWVPNQFAIHTFRIIMFSIQAQYSYAVVETLMAHLDENSKSSPKIRTSIADVLSKIIAIAASESVGPSVLEIINSLLSHLRVSVISLQSQHDEKMYQEALINALGEFANHLPDYQKIEIMMFIMSKVPQIPTGSGIANNASIMNQNVTSADTLLQNILLKSLLKVGTKYQTIHMNTTFPISFLEPLLRMSLVQDSDMRILVQRILHTLIDRHSNLEKLLKPTTNINDLDINYDKSSRQDLIFINKHGPLLYDTLYGCIELSTNTVENIDALYTTLSLLLIELISEETLGDYLQLLFGIQSMCLINQQTQLSIEQLSSIIAMVLSVMLIIPHVVSISGLSEYLHKIIDERRTEAPYLLPDYYTNGSVTDSAALQSQLPPSQLPHLMVDKLMVTECLRANGIDSSVLQLPCPYVSGHGASHYAHRHSWVEVNVGGATHSSNNNYGNTTSGSTGSSSQYTTSTNHLANMHGGQDGADSVSSSPIISRMSHPSIPITAYPSIAVSFNDSPLDFKPSVQSSLIEHNLEISTSWFRLVDSMHSKLQSVNSSFISSIDDMCTICKTPEEELTIEAMKKVLAEPPEITKQIEADRRQYINDTFNKLSFTEIMKHTQPKHENLHNILNDIFTSIQQPSTHTTVQSNSSILSTSNHSSFDGGSSGTPSGGVSGVGGLALASLSTIMTSKPERVPIYEEYFPELFVY